MASLAGAIVRLRATIERVSAWKPVAFLLRIVFGLYDHSAFLAASAMAFNFFLSFAPLLVLLGFILGHVVKKNGVETFLVPVAAAMPFAQEMVRRELERLADTHLGVAPASAAGFLWLASSGASSLVDTFEIALGTKRRPFWERRAIALGWVIGMIAALSGTLWLWIAVDAWLHPGTFSVGQGRVVVSRLTWEPWLLLGALGIVGASGLAVLYRYAVVHPAGVVRRAWPGAIVATLACFGVTFAFGRYVMTLANYALFYGSAAAVATLLVWLYLTSLSLLLGAEVNAELEGVRKK
jgi:membrane protein